MALQLWQILKEAILAFFLYSPLVILTVLSLFLVLLFVIAMYQMALGWFTSLLADLRARSSTTDEVPRIPQPVQVGEITENELRQYDGSDPKKPLLMAIKHQIYDVTTSRMAYGPGGPYALFGGREVSRALAKMSFEEKDLTWDISGLSPFELDALQDWEEKFMSKYTKVGSVKVTGSKAEITSVTEPAETSDKNAHVIKQETIVVDKNDLTSVSGIYSDIETGLIVKV
ncbi:membrane steroid-binding protein 1-like [Raphanus sativus]|uniref:Membrane steroid-binding protein 1-like n=1 Tax=Raphanus sativus TaxID=3726 RepID=A0A6J0MNX6_RAPSA|nr:membrane steroid-binding protein 1-like [Raphanus sativus]